MTREQFISHVEACRASLRRCLVALCCGDKALADDIAQESLVKAYLSSDGFEHPEKFNAWIYRIAFNTFLNHRRTIRPTVDCDSACNLAATERSDDTFRYQDLYAALGQLPQRERTSVVLFYIEGYTVKEISTIVETSEDAVRQHLTHGRKHLRVLLDPKTEMT